MKLQLRVGDVEFWKGELDNKLAQLKEEIEEVKFSWMQLTFNYGLYQGNVSTLGMDWRQSVDQ